jgi:hypothetical protein
MTYELLPTTSIVGDVTASLSDTTSTRRPFISAIIKATFVRAAGGSGTDAWVQCSADRGTTWHDVVNFHFVTTNLAVYVNLSGATAVTTPAALTDGTMTANSATDATLTNMFRVKYTTTGTYGAGTTLKVWMVTRDSA